MTSEKAKRQQRKIIKIGRTSGVFLLIIIVTAIILGVMFSISSNQPAVRGANAFLTALKNENYAAAYSQLSDSLQVSIGSVEALELKVISALAQPTEWNVTLQSTRSRDNVGSLQGGVVAADGHYYPLFMTLVEQNGEWRISYVRYGSFQLYGNRQ